jgi:hypothetical protein
VIRAAHGIVGTVIAERYPVRPALVLQKAKA